MSDVAALIADLIRAGVEPDLIGRTAAILVAQQQPIRTARQERNKRYYDSKKASEKRLNSDGQDVSDADSPILDKEKSPTPPKEIKPSPSSKPNGFSLSARDYFSEFWLAYPRRDGDNPQKPARLIFQRLLAKGADPDRLIAAAQALALKHPSPTPYVPQAKTWLNQERFADAEPVIAGDTFCAEDEPNTRWHVIRYHDEHDGADPPRAAYGGKAGYLIPATWVKAMQMRQASGN